MRKDIRLVVSGRLEYFQGLQIAHPDFEFLDPNEEKQLVHTGRIIPLYATSEALKKKAVDSRSLRRLIIAALDIEESKGPLIEILPPEILRKHSLLERHKALRAIHFPTSMAENQSARQRLKYEELYLFQILVYHRALLQKKLPRLLRPLGLGHSSKYQALIEKLPFHLTPDQQKAISHILKCCQAKNPCSFLLQGDVGSGKTLVALGTALHYLEAEIQTALIAPTEVLARQHFLVLSDLLGLAEAHQLELLTGSDRKKEGLAKRARIATGEAKLIVGTHALLSKKCAV